MAKRKIYLDYLRVFSVFCVIVLHVSAGNWAYLPVTSENWRILNMYDSIVRFAVPVFIMISGALMLDENYHFSIKKLYTKNIKRIILAFIFWSGFYALVKFLTTDNSLRNLVKNLVLGHYHMWFLYTIIVIYILLPVIRKISEDDEIFKYFLVVSCVLLFGLNLIKSFDLTANLANSIAGFIKIEFGFITYFCLGHYLNKFKISDKNQTFLYILGIASIMFTIYATEFISLKNGIADSRFFSYLMPNVLFVAVSVFLAGKNLFKSYEKSEKVVKVSNLSFGIFLIHPFVLSIIYDYMTILSFNPMFSVLIISILAFFISMILTYFMSKIKFLNKFI